MNHSFIGQRIRTLRKAKGLTLVAVAGEEFTKGYISQVELGKVEPSFKLLSHIANKLDVKVEQLLSSDNELDTKLAIMENDLSCKRYKNIVELGKGIDDIDNHPIIAKIKVMQLNAFYYLNRYQDAIDLAKEILKLNQDWSKGYRLEAYSFMGVSMFSQDLYSEVIKLYDEAFEFAADNELNTSKLLANMYLNRATAFYILKAYKKAVTAYHETLEFAKTHECMETVLDAFLRMGFCYYKLGELELAKSYIFDGFRINKVLGIKLLQAESFLALGYVLTEESNYKAAEVILNKSLLLFEEMKSVNGIVESSFVLAGVYKKSNQFEMGKKRLLECFKMIESSKISMFEHDLITDIAKLCMAYELHEEASKLFSKLVD